MREILFRGKRRDNGQWIEGFFVLAYDHNAPDEKTAHIAVDMPWGPCGCCAEVFEVDPNTVGQYTGLKDKNGVKIFEGDTVRMRRNYVIGPGESMPGVAEERTVGFNFGCFLALDETGGGSFLAPHGDIEIEVIGNIHDKEGCAV